MATQLRGDRARLTPEDGRSSGRTVRCRVPAGGTSCTRGSALRLPTRRTSRVRPSWHRPLGGPGSGPAWAHALTRTGPEPLAPRRRSVSATTDPALLPASERQLPVRRGHPHGQFRLSPSRQRVSACPPGRSCERRRPTLAPRSRSQAGSSEPRAQPPTVRRPARRPIACFRCSRGRPAHVRLPTWQMAAGG